MTIKKDIPLKKSTQSKIETETKRKSALVNFWGTVSAYNYENTQLLVRYPAFLKAYNKLERSHKINDNSIRELLEGFNAEELFENIKAYIQNNKFMSPVPHSKGNEYERLESGRNFRESWLSFRLRGVPGIQSGFSFVEGLSLSLYNSGFDDDVIPNDFPKNVFSYTYLSNEDSLEFHIRLKRAERPQIRLEHLSAVIETIARDYFEQHKLIPNLDTKLVLLDEISKEIQRQKVKRRYTDDDPEAINSSIGALYRIYVIENQDLLSDKELAEADDAIKKKYDSYRKIRSEISRIQKKRFVKIIQN